VKIGSKNAQVNKENNRANQKYMCVYGYRVIMTMQMSLTMSKGFDVLEDFLFPFIETKLRKYLPFSVQHVLIKILLPLCGITRYLIR
jgi:hypothetical protein